MTKTFSRKLTLYSFLCTMAVVLAHYKVTGDIPVQSVPGLDQAIWEGSDRVIEQCLRLAMKFFFLKSAFLFYRNATEENVFRKIKGRLYSLGVPFLIWNSFKLTVRMLFGQEWPFSGPGDLLRGFTYGPYNGPTWYMAALLLFLPLAPLLVRIKSKWMVCAATLILIPLPKLVPDLLLQDEAAWVFLSRWTGYWSDYLLGYLLARLWGDSITQERYQKKPVNAVCGILLLLWFLNGSGGLPLPLLSAPAVAKAMELLVPVLFWLALDSTMFKKNPPFAIDISFYLYVGHEIVMLTLERILPPLIIKTGFVFCGWQALVLRLGQTALLYGVILAGVYAGQRLLPPSWFALLSGSRVQKKAS